MPKLMKQQNGQFLLTIPKGVVNALGVERGDKIEFRINLKKGIVELIKSCEEQS